MVICTIYYNKGGKELEYKCSAYSLNAITEELKKQGAEIKEVSIHKPLKSLRKELTENEIEIRKYYRYRYTTYYRLLKKRKYKSRNIQRN